MEAGITSIKGRFQRVAAALGLGMVAAAFAAEPARSARISGFRSSGGGHGMMGGGGRGPMPDGSRRPGGDGEWGPRHLGPRYPSGPGGWVDGGAYDPAPVMIEEDRGRAPATRKATIIKPGKATSVPPRQRIKPVQVARPKPVVVAEPNQAPGQLLFEAKDGTPVEAIERLAGRYGLSRIA